LDGLATFESLAASESYTCSPEAFYPNVLIYYDLPGLVGAIQTPVLIANPLDAAKESLSEESADVAYRAIREDGRIQVVAAGGDADVVSYVHGLLATGGPG
jgi:hypothetical protein